MSVILLTKGPVCTVAAIHQNGPVVVRKIVKSQFLRAASLLDTANLGFLVQVTLGFKKNSVHDVFIKKEPSEVKEALEENKDLCSFEEYTARFYMPAPAIIRPALRDELIHRQLVKKEHFMSMPIAVKWH